MPTLLLDGQPIGSKYTSLDIAEPALVDQAAGCYAEVMSTSDSGGTFTSQSSRLANGILEIRSQKNFTFVNLVQDKILTRLFLTAKDGLSVNFSLQSALPGPPRIGSYRLALYADDQITQIAQVINSAPFTGTFVPTIPADGYYYVYATISQNFSPPGGAGTIMDVQITVGNSMIPCLVRAAYGTSVTNYISPLECGTCNTNCSIECVSFTTIKGCNDRPSPGPGAGCCSQNHDFPCINPPGAGTIVTTAQARLAFSNLTIGQSYTGSISFCQFNNNSLIGTSVTTISFTATDTTETTEYFNIPNATFDADYWCACACSLNPA